MAVAYDVVLEDHILAHQAVKRRARPFAREVAEMVRYAVGYQSRAFVTFGTPIPLDGFDPESRRDVMALAHQTRDSDRAALQGAADGGRRRRDAPSITRRELEARADAIIDAVRAAGGEPGRHVGPRRRSRKAPSRSPPATSFTSSAADGSASASGPSCATTRARSSTC